MDNVAPEARGAAQTAALDEARCRNCGAPAADAFCPRCGQKTTLKLPSARQFLKDAAGRYVALDGRMWRTLAALLFHPGFLTREYLAGRRRRYVRPARLFLVLSLALFAVLRFVVDVPQFIEGAEAIRIDPPTDVKRPAASEERIEAPLGKIEWAWPGMSLRIDESANLALDGPEGRLTEELRRRVERFNAMSRQDKTEQLFLGTMRYGPYAMFVLLPVFALLLQLVYLGRARSYPARPTRYAEHLVFAAHNHAFLALVATLAAVIAWSPAGTVLAIWALVYALWSMKAVYGGHWLGVFARAWLVAIAYFVMFGFVTVGLVLAAVMLR